MTRSRPGQGWVAKTISSDVPPGKRELALRIQQLCRHLTGESGAKKGILKPTQAQAAKRLGISETSLSRFLSGYSVPAMELLALIHASAREDAASDFPADITLADLRNLRDRANADHCDSCVTLRAELEQLGERSRKGSPQTPAAVVGPADISTEGTHPRSIVMRLTQQLGTLEAQRDQLQQRCDHSEAEADRLRAEIAQLGSRLASAAARGAGLKSRPAAAAASQSDPLPVPPSARDRQRTASAGRAAGNIAAKAGALQRGGRQGSMLSLLHHTVRTLSHAEIAALMCLLRHQQERELADNLIHIYGRDQSHQDVVQVALELHERGAPDDAGTLLRIRATL
ncbi:helix-turn-helix domain-containing protein [Streptomyces sp. CAI-85]|uniref:helix-turn-helix domain-containing protein n=1 Tax=Streptomyces sp. CAI-85 TaxID=1472662 RepID=UPI001587A4C1|nr:helix-turn-helix domain-containing protein [Streptomyces sp. CAI-85]NUV60003.1 hypothetical protein [Streptomyces sp. CAI-85]